MKIKEQIVSVNLFFAAAIGIFTQIVLNIINTFTPFVYFYLSLFQKRPDFGEYEEAMKNAVNQFWGSLLEYVFRTSVLIVILLIIALLFLIASKQIKKQKRIKLWSIIGLIISFVYMAVNGSMFGAGFIISILGITGSVFGFIYSEETNK